MEYFFIFFVNVMLFLVLFVIISIGVLVSKELFLVSIFVKVVLVVIFFIF